MQNVLTVDVEDYFQVEAFASHIRYDEWDSYKPRVERNVARILELFARYRTRATFFILGWVAERFPHLVREIGAAGHEIGSHGFAHRRLHNLNPEHFRKDLRNATAVITEHTQRPIQCYRAPSFSIVQSTMWAFEVLAEEGYSFDSSVFPVLHDLYGIPQAERFPNWYTSQRGHRVFEFPPSTIRRGNINVGIAGGGYLRLMPYGLTYWAIRNINEVEEQPAMVYFHPWEIDPDQPSIRAGTRSTLRHYTNLSTMEGKIERLLQDFHFTTLSEACLKHKAYLSSVADAISAPADRQRVAVRAAGAGRK